MSFTKIWLVGVISAYSASVSAQKFDYGVKVGGSLTYTNFAEQDDRKFLRSGLKSGFNVGGLIGFPLKKNCTFLVEGGFSQQGRKWFYRPNESEWTFRYYFADMSMALRKNFTLKLFKNIPSNWFVNIGPNINYWISGHGKWKFMQAPGVPGIPADLKVAFDEVPNPNVRDKIYVNRENRWLYGINIGVGFNVTTTKYQRIMTELRLTWGQTYLGQRDSEFIGNVAATDQTSLKCNLKTLNLSVAYIFEKERQRSKMGKSTKKVR